MSISGLAKLSGAFDISRFSLSVSGFESGLALMKRGHEIQRASWPEGRWIYIPDARHEGWRPDEDYPFAEPLPELADGDLPSIFMRWEDGVKLTPWTPERADIVANNWQHPPAPAPVVRTFQKIVEVRAYQEVRHGEAGYVLDDGPNVGAWISKTEFEAVWKRL